MINKLKSSNIRYIRAVLAFETACVILLVLYSHSFWSLICTDGYKTCLSNSLTMTPLNFLILSLFRPFTFAPQVYLTYLAGHTFSPPILSIMLIIGGSLLSTTLMYGIGRILSRRWAIQWLRTNMPETLRLFQYHDFKIVLGLRISSWRLI